MMIPVVVRHAGSKYDVEVDVTQPGIVFKSQLFSLTGVPPERQKILSRGGQLKDDADMSALGLKPGHSFMMLGSAGDLPKAPVLKNKFIEDMSDQELAQSQAQSQSAEVAPSGLINTGNTCYLNATLQALRTVPELMDLLKGYQHSSSVGSDLTVALRDVYSGLNGSTQAYMPALFLALLRNRFPQFDEIGEGGVHKQQDAEEAWSQILSVLRSSLTGEDDTFVDRYFGGRFETVLTCDETDEEPEKRTVEPFVKLDCHITVSTNFVRDGLLAGLKEQLEKNSPVLGRNAQFTLTKRVVRLPQYLTVHYMRFFWRRDTNKKSKILRKVVFPLVYDASELCSEDLKRKLLPARESFHDAERKIQELNKHKELTPEGKAELEAQVEASLDPDLKADRGSNPIGLYELAAVVTHQGPTADAGHYQCFARAAHDKTQWWRFNDDRVSLVDEARIEGLAGGGESDSALILLYRTVRL